MGLNLSNRQIAHELGIDEEDAQQMTPQLRRGVVDASTTPILSGTVDTELSGIRTYSSSRSWRGQRR